MAINMWLKTFFFLNPTWPAEIKRLWLHNFIPGVLEEVLRCCWRRLVYGLLQSQRACTCDRSGWRRDQREAPRPNSAHSLRHAAAVSAAHVSARLNIRQHQASGRRRRKRRIIKCSSNDSSDWPSLYRPINLSIPCDTCIEKCHSYRWRVWRRSSFKKSGLYLMSLRSSGCIEAYDSQWEEVHALLASRQC